MNENARSAPDNSDRSRRNTLQIVRPMSNAEARRTGIDLSAMPIASTAAPVTSHAAEYVQYSLSLVKCHSARNSPCQAWRTDSVTKANNSRPDSAASPSVYQRGLTGRAYSATRPAAMPVSR